MADQSIQVLKTCSKCGCEKPLEAFAKASTGADGRRGDCKQCRKRYNDRWYSELSDERKIERRGDPAERAAWQAAYYLRNKDYFRAQGERWMRANIDKHRESTRLAMRRRRETVKGRLENNVSRALNRALKGRKNGEPAFGLLRFTVEELITHLERQFMRGMNWQNYGEWHVDHIRPLASFRYDDPSDPEFREAWAITNLRPLWARENISKGAKRLLLV
jgi:hypothetical protein